jgi:hypothetical protein
MDREQEREESGGGLLVHPPGIVAVAGACFKGGAEERGLRGVVAVVRL